MTDATKSNDGLEALRDWFGEWNRYVMACDFESARSLFDAAVSGFGTFAAMVHGREALEREQWRNVWPKITGFNFEVDKLHGDIRGEMAWAAVPWSSTGYHQDGSAFDRPGRATVVLKQEAGRWLGVHTHFSLAPGTPARTFGPRDTA
jgi:ketosteroid isomerase-like protein